MGVRSLMRKRITLLIAALTMALTMSFSGEAFAQIQPADASCSNPSGQKPGGQQPSCKNDTLTPEETENQNPAGKAPGGQNKWRLRENFPATHSAE